MKGQFAKIRYKDRDCWCKVVDGKYYELINSIYDEVAKVSDQPIDPLEKAELLPPCDAKKIIAFGYNYKGLVGAKKSHEEPIVFFKSLSGLVADQADVRYPSFGKKVWLEVELAIIIKKAGKNIVLEQANDHILGYTCGNDITCENILNRDWHLARAKGLDTFCPLGPYLIKGIDVSNLKLRSYINEKVSQESTTSDMILSVEELIVLASRYFSLGAGDVILTGTPAGATDAVIRPGDKIKIEVESIGVLENKVVKEVQ